MKNYSKTTTNMQYTDPGNKINLLYLLVMFLSIFVIYFVLYDISFIIGILALNFIWASICKLKIYQQKQEHKLAQEKNEYNIKKLQAKQLASFKELESKQLAYFENSPITDILRNYINEMKKSYSDTNECYRESLLYPIKNIFEAISGIFDDEKNEDLYEYSLNINNFLEDNGTTLKQFVELIIDTSKQSVATVQRMDDMISQMNQIYSLLEEIDNISSQTNLLALNAAIEAARAGDSGRGFAVVADQVRSLSGKTVSFSSDVRKEVQTSQNMLNDARNIVCEVASKDMQHAIFTQDKVDSMLNELSNISSNLNEKISFIYSASSTMQERLDSHSKIFDDSVLTQKISELEIAQNNILNEISKLNLKFEQDMSI